MRTGGGLPLSAAQSWTRMSRVTRYRCKDALEGETPPTRRRFSFRGASVTDRAVVTDNRLDHYLLPGAPPAHPPRAPRIPRLTRYFSSRVFPDSSGPAGLSTSD